MMIVQTHRKSGELIKFAKLMVNFIIMKFSLNEIHSLNDEAITREEGKFI